MNKLGMPISGDTISKILRTCQQNGDIAALRRADSLMIDSGLFSISHLVDHLIRLFGLCGCLGEADRIFRRILEPTLPTWNAIISSHAKLGRSERVLELFQEMKAVHVKPDSHILACLLKACGSLQEIANGRLIHEQVIANELEAETVLGNCLIDMYAKCGHLDDSCKVLEQLLNRDVVSWGTMVAGYVQQGHFQAALEVFLKMQSSGYRPTQVTLLVAIKACGGIEALDWGRKIHSQVVEGAYEADVLIGSTLVDMYAKCGCLEDCLTVFEQLRSRNVVSWCALIGGCTHHGQNLLALQWFGKMLQAGISASKVTFLCALKACANMEALEPGRLIYHQIIESGLPVDMLVGSSLLDMYAKCGELEEARKMFDDLPTPDVVSWSALIAGYSHHGQDLLALDFFGKMQSQNIQANKITFMCLLRACSNLEALEQGQMIHDQIVRMDLESEKMVASSLIDLYGKCGSLEDSRRLFDLQRHPDVVTWAAMISAYAQHDQGHAALQLFYNMQNKHITPDKFIVSCTLKACGTVGAVMDGRKLHRLVLESGLDSDIVVGNALLDMFAKCGSLTEARKVFDTLSKRDTVSWGTMIAGYVLHTLGSSAIDLFDAMCQSETKPDKVIFVSTLMACGDVKAIEHGKHVHECILQSGIDQDEVLGSSLIDMYVKCGDLEEARTVFDVWPKRNVASWDGMIAGYVEQGLHEDALNLFVKMLEEQLTPNKAILSCILKICSKPGAIDRGRLVHDIIVRASLEADVAIGSALVDTYVKCGSLYEGHQVLNRLTNSNVVSWGALIDGYAERGNFVLIRQCLVAMGQQGIMPNDTIFLNILSACSHTAHLEEGLSFFDLMKEYGVKQGPEHVSCMVDLLGRAGQLKEAGDILNSVPLLPNIVRLNSLLVNSKTHGNTQLGTCYFDNLQPSISVGAL